MQVVIQIKKRDEIKAVPILVRHSPGVMLKNRIYILSEGAVKALQDAGIRFTELSRGVDVSHAEGAGSGERI